MTQKIPSPPPPPESRVVREGEIPPLDGDLPPVPRLVIALLVVAGIWFPFGVYRAISPDPDAWYGIPLVISLGYLTFAYLFHLLVLCGRAEAKKKARHEARDALLRDSLQFILDMPLSDIADESRRVRYAEEASALARRFFEQREASGPRLRWPPPPPRKP